MPRSVAPSTEEPESSEESSLHDAVDEVVRAIAHAPARPPPSDPQSGTRWGERGRYVIARRLGRGGMGTVYLATDTLLGREVALKVLDAGPDPEEDQRRSRLLREARLAAGLEHERIARVYDVGEHDDSTFVAMEYVRGLNLRTWMVSPHPPAEILSVALQIAEGLAVLHARGVIHRDLKPENVMLQGEGGVKLLDFGLAGHVGGSREGPVEATSAARGDARTTGAFRGTPGYMAPEQYAGEHVDARADVFALGVIVHELVTGSRPFHGATMPALLRAIREEPRAERGPAWAPFPVGLGRAVDRMLAADPRERPADGSAVRVAIEEPLPARTRATPSWRVALALGVLGAAAAGALATRSIWRARGTPAAPAPGMVWIPGGAIRTGATEAEAAALCAKIGDDCDRERLAWSVPPREAHVAPYYLDDLEVTNGDIVAWLNDLRASLLVAPDEETHTPRYVRYNTGLGHDGEVLLDLFDSTTGVRYSVDGNPATKAYSTRPGRERWPVTQVTFFAARGYCAARGKRLPTEDEWEAAARGAEDRRYPWGAEPVRCGGVRVPPDGKTDSAPGCPPTPLPTDVGASLQDVTPQGVHDLGGNVGEWVDTVFAPHGTPPPTGPDSELPHVTRGGSFAISLAANTFVRSRQLPVGAGINGGFRCARSLSSP